MNRFLTATALFLSAAPLPREAAARTHTTDDHFTRTHDGHGNLNMESEAGRMLWHDTLRLYTPTTESTETVKEWTVYNMGGEKTTKADKGWHILGDGDTEVGTIMDIKQAWLYEVDADGKNTEGEPLAPSRTLGSLKTQALFAMPIDMESCIEEPFATYLEQFQIYLARRGQLRVERKRQKLRLRELGHELYVRQKELWYKKHKLQLEEPGIWQMGFNRDASGPAGWAWRIKIIGDEARVVKDGLRLWQKIRVGSVASIEASSGALAPRGDTSGRGSAVTYLLERPSFGLTTHTVDGTRGANLSFRAGMWGSSFGLNDTVRITDLGDNTFEVRTASRRDRTMWTWRLVEL